MGFSLPAVGSHVALYLTLRERERELCKSDEGDASGDVDDEAKKAYTSSSSGFGSIYRALGPTKLVIEGELKSNCVLGLQFIKSSLYVPFCFLPFCTGFKEQWKD